MENATVIDWHRTGIQTALDFDWGGRQVGDPRLRYSNAKKPLGYWPMPAAILAGAPGPALLRIGGADCDEFEGLAPRTIETVSPLHTVYARCDGLFERRFEQGDAKEEGAAAGTLYPLFEPELLPLMLALPASGIVLLRIDRGLVERENMFATIAVECIQAF